MRGMVSSEIAAAMAAWLCLGALPSLSAETLKDALKAAVVPTAQFSQIDLDAKITSYAVSEGEPFLLAYYVDNGSGLIQPPLRVVRYDRASGSLRRSDFSAVAAPFQPATPIALDCLGSAITISEHASIVYIDTHCTPSAGCLIVLSSALELKTAVSGWLLGVIGADYAIFQGSEIHFMSVHPLHIEVLNLKRNQPEQVYPFANDPQRRAFSKLIQPLISNRWCMDNNAQCDPDNFDADVKGGVIVNEAAKLFGFEAQFDAGGFGDAAETRVKPRAVAYVYRERGGTWEHREFGESELQRLLSGVPFAAAVSKHPGLFFPQSPAR